MQLHEKEIEEVLEYIKSRKGELDALEGELDELIGGPKTEKELELSLQQFKQEIGQARARLLSNATAVLLSVSTLAQKLNSIPKEILDTLREYLEKLVRTVSKYMGAFRIQSITLTIKIPLSLEIVFTPQ